MNFVIVDDYPLARHGLKSLLALQKKNVVVGEASNVKEAIDIILKENPDISLINLELNNENGFDIIDSTKDKTLSKFIVFVSLVNQFDLYKMEQMNIAGCIAKNALSEDVLYAISLVSRGRKYYDSALLELKFNKNSKKKYMDQLTSREKEVLEELEKGLSNEQIAKKLFITSNTVKKHISQILSKLNVHDRTQAALFSIKYKYMTYKY